MTERTRRWARIVAIAVSAVLTLAGCAVVLDGHASLGNAPNANIAVKGSDNGHFDTVTKNALSDIEAFWTTQFPKISGGRALPPLKGGFYSVDGLKVAETGKLTGPVRFNACAKKTTAFVIDNGAFCIMDDSISWDRAPTHLFAQLAKKYGDLLIALIFAHEFGHAISYRMGVFNTPHPTVDTESQADCAAGAWAASALKGRAAHFRNVTAASLDSALEGFLDGRDGTPGTIQDISHGNGFDRLSAVADGIDMGPSYCFSKGYFASRHFTERPFSDPNDYAQGGNSPLSSVLAPPGTNAFVKDLNRFWTAAAKTVNKTFKPVTIAEAAHPKCAPSGPAEFGYCASDNTVYYNRRFAQSVYYSLPGVSGNSSNGNITLVDNQPGDFALGVMFVIGWGMAVRHQLFNRSTSGKDALLSAVCYTGSYAKDVNITKAQSARKTLIYLSPSDLDEAVSSMLDEVGTQAGFGSRGTSGLTRIQNFVQGYNKGLSSC